MPDQVTIPTVQSVAQFKIRVGGNDIAVTDQLLGVHISKTINRITTARFVLMDFDADSRALAKSNSATFIPGAEIEILAGPPDNPVSVFKGIIIKHSLKIRMADVPQLIIECKHKAVKTTIARKNAVFHDTTDSDVFSTLLTNNSITTTSIEATTVQHKHLVQFNCTDWDFMLSRAEANGKIILTNDDTVIIKRPDFSAAAALILNFGSTIFELDAEIDSRYQYGSVKSKSWDIANQNMTETEAANPNITEQGNLASANLTSVMQAEVEMNHDGALHSDETQAWANAQLLKSRMSKIRGRVKFDGVAGINAGDLIELQNCGDRFNGTAFVSAVRHDFDLREGWKTQAQFGHDAKFFLEENNDANDKQAGAITAGINGLHIGIVVDNEDPEGEFRVRVKMPFIDSDTDGVWARIASLDAGNNRGTFFRPEIGDEVILGFIYDDPRKPVILGMFNSSAKTAPLSPSNSNNEKGYVSREGIKMIFNDENKSLKIETPGGNKFELNDNSLSVKLEDMTGNKIEMKPDGIKIQSATKLELIAGTQLVIGGASFSVSANGSVEITGNGSAKLSSSGTTIIQGSLVQIN